MILRLEAYAASAASYLFRSVLSTTKKENFFDQGVNRASTADVVVPSQESSSMNTTHMLNASPDDERDRKRAPARC